MFDIAFLLLFCIVSYSSIRTLRREKQIISELGLSQAIAWLTLLFPFGPIVLFIGTATLPLPLPHLVATACYVPSVLVAYTQTRHLDRVGTDRTDNAQKATSRIFNTALIGLAYVAASFVLLFGLLAV